MKVDSTYWKVISDIVMHEADNLKLSNGLIENCKIIAKTKRLWRIASREYLATFEPSQFSEITCKLNKYADENSYFICFQIFNDLLSRKYMNMTLNRWLELQMYLNKADFLAYQLFSKEFKEKLWIKEIEGGYPEDMDYVSELDKQCTIDFKEKLIPQIEYIQETTEEL